MKRDDFEALLYISLIIVHLNNSVNEKRLETSA